MAQYRETKAAEIQSYKVNTTVTPVVGGNDIPAKRIVVQTAANTINLAVLGTAPLCGVTIDGGDIGSNLDVQSGGLAIVTSGAAIAINAQVTAGALGKAVTAAATDFIIGYARSVASGADIDITVQMEIGAAD